MTNVTTAAAADDLRSIKPPIRIPGEWTWLWWTLAGLVVAGAIAAWLWRRHRRQVEAAVIVPPVPPHIRARQRLAEALLFISEPDRFCTAVSSTLRIYLEERFQLHAPERTTEEFLIELQSSPALNAEQKKSLQGFLQSCDLVKFARLEPNETTLRELHDAALRLVDETQFEAVAQPGSAGPSADAPDAPPPPPPGMPSGPSA